MNKNELKNAWGNYCDTDKLVDDVIALLTKYHHNCTENGVCKMLDCYFENKIHLITMFMNSENYVGDMRICVDHELDRSLSQSEIISFCSRFVEEVGAKEIICKRVDEYGKTLKDYSRVGVRSFNARDHRCGRFVNNLAIHAKERRNFRSDGYTVESYKNYNNFWLAIDGFKYSSGSKLERRTIDNMEAVGIHARLAAGMKTSRAFNRVCSMTGVDKLPKYNKMFAEYSDMVSGLKRKIKFYISVNPLDYLTMSFGKSWSSCHTIDKLNERGMQNGYQGMHCGGIMSYMLDATSIITYVHNHTMENYEEGKLYRNMFHFDRGTLVQGRIYPQGNDGSTDLYKTFRGFMQDEFTKMLGLNDTTWVKKGGDCSDYIISYGTHYRDYEHFEGCNISYPKEWFDASINEVEIGHSRICPYCGEIVADFEDDGRLTHSDCHS